MDESHIFNVASPHAAIMMDALGDHATWWTGTFSVESYRTRVGIALSRSSKEESSLVFLFDGQVKCCVGCFFLSGCCFVVVVVIGGERMECG